MLRRYTIAHFALEHSPEKEQRLLLVDPRDDAQKKIGNAESQNLPDGADTNLKAVDPVEMIRMRVAEQTIAVDPKQVLEHLKTNGMATLDILIGSNALEPEREALGIEDRTLEPNDASNAVESLFRNDLPDERIFSTVGAIRKKIDEYEESTRNVELSIKHMFRLNVDPSAIESALAAISRYETQNDGEGILESIKDKLIDEDNVCRILKIDGEYTLEQKKVFLGILENMSRGNRARRSFGQKVPPENDKARTEARNRFLGELNGTADTIAEYLDARINARAKKLLEESMNLFRTFDIDDPQDRFGVTKDGIEDAFNDVFMELKDINRYHGADGRAPIKSENGLLKAHAAIASLDDIERLLVPHPNDRERLPTLLVEKRVTESDRVAWAQEMAKAMKTVNLPAIEKQSPVAAEKMREFIKFFAAFAPGNTPSDDEIIAMKQTETDRQNNIAWTIRSIEQNPKAFETMKLEELDVITPETEIESVVNDTRNLMSEIFPEIFEKIDHPTAHILKLDKGIRTIEQRIRNGLESKNGRMVARASLEAKRLQECKNTLDELLSGKRTRVLPTKQFYEVVPHSGHAETVGYYDYEDGLIYVNQSQLTETLTKEIVVEHELGHAIPDAFRRTGVFVNLMDTVYEGLKNEEAADGTPFDQLLLQVADSWGISIEHPNAISEDERWQLMDELVNQYALWGKKGRPTVSPNERRLFNVFDRKQEKPESAPPIRKLTGGVRMNLPGAAAPDELFEPEEQHPAPEEGGRYVENELNALEKGILNTEEFLKAYPEHVQQFKEYGYEKMKTDTEHARKVFMDGSYTHDLASFNQILADVKEKLNREGGIRDFIEENDIAKIDLTYESKIGGRSMWQRITEDTTWVSVYDVMAMFKDAGTDIARMWKRRGESSRKKLGADITKLIHDKVPYLGRLKHEFERSERESELEEVGVWEKGLDKIDVHVLHHEILPTVRNKDHLKAILNVLTKKGRLEWDDDHGLWERLEYFSGYRMPREACKRDSRLRNQWLQKMIADIWRDKDQYEHWKAENDGAIDSGRKHLDSYVEELSAAGTLRTELRKLLKNFTRQKQGELIDKQEEVNPHLYEGIIFYAMRNGKMSMEEKFYYLVKGVEIGLISVDRLRAFSGENFGILNSFPFIDFFSSGQNCDMYEIKNIAKKITETDADHAYRPGAKMTKFMMEVVAFDKNVKDRVNKALKRAENIDHEDIPMLITQLDYTGVSQIINFTSGSQAKSSAPAIKNAYVGYNTFLKYFGMKAKMGKPPLTNRDIGKIVTTLGAYTLWDNITTRYSLGAAKDARPSLSWEQIDNEAPVSGSKMTREYRDVMNKFTLKLCKAIDITDVNGIRIEDYIGVDRNSKTIDTIYNDAEKKRWYEQKGIAKGDFSKKIELGSEDFQEKLMNGIRTHQAEFMQLLQEAEKTFIPENDDFTMDNLAQNLDKEVETDLGHAHGGHH